MREEQLGDLVGEDAVDLLGHRPVAAAQARLDVGDRDLQVRAGERRRERRVDVARHDHQVGLLGGQDRRDRFEDAADLDRVRAGSDAEHVVGLGHAELVEEDLRHHPVVVLTGVDEHVPAVGVDRAQGGDDRRHLHEVRARPDDVEEPHRTHAGQASASIRAASSKSAAVSPPSEWVEIRTVTVAQEISRSG